MDILLRELDTSSGQTGDYVDRELSGEPITIGSRQDQTLQLLGAQVQGQHAELQVANGQISVKAVDARRVVVNGEEVKSARLAEGDTLHIGGHQLTCISSPAGFDGGLQLERDTAVDSASFENAYQTSIKDTWLSKRTVAWTLSALVLVFGFAIPLFLVVDGDESTPDLDAALLTDAIWTSGPLHAVHNQSIGDDCGACHTELFERVQDEACLACHTNVADHVVAGHVSLEVKPIERCATCHKEHNEPTLLVITADSLCSDCHAEPELLAGDNPHMLAATGFDQQTHPSFEVALPIGLAQPGPQGLDFEWQLTEVKLAGATEASNLKFPHDLHLDPESVRVRGGGGLGCGDCHTLALDQEHFVPISMEAHCQDCHELTFDAASPERQLPHGQPSEAVATMEAHFIRLYANPQKVAPPTRERRRRPSRSSSAAVTDSCSGSILQCAKQRTETEVASQFTRSGCVTCHVVEDSGSRDISTRFQVYPVRLPADFMPTAKFDHKAHLTQKGVSGDEACLTCHEAEQSSVSTDVLVPDIDNCTSCHTDHRVADSVPLDCVDCHAFHPLGQQPLEYLERVQ